MTHYAKLGVDKGASQEDIKKAYRKLASKHHPDKAGGDTQKFQSIQVAYEVLGDAEQRAIYDQQLMYGNQQRHFTSRQGHGFGNVNDYINELHRQFNFGGGFGRGFQPGSNRQTMNRDIRIALSINAIDTLEQQTRTIKLTLPSGKEATIDLKIPRGIANEDTMKFAGVGDDSVEHAPKGDLYVNFRVIFPENFDPVGVDLINVVSVNCLDAMLGCKKQITGIDGKTFSVTIPPGSQHGDKLGISDQGMYSMHRPGRGKLIILLHVYVIQDLNEEDRAQIKVIADKYNSSH